MVYSLRKPTESLLDQMTGLMVTSTQSLHLILDMSMNLMVLFLMSFARKSIGLMEIYKKTTLHLKDTAMIMEQCHSHLVILTERKKDWLTLM